MQYLTGYTIKPYVTEPSGEVLFTDGTNNDIRANQQQCRAYGYTYDPVTGTCRSFKYNSRLNSAISNINNKINGAGNATQLGSSLIQINGTNNTTEGFNSNCFISGSDNTIANGVSNATVLGSNGTALRDGEFVIGSGNAYQPMQISSLFLWQTTTNNAATSMTVNGNKTIVVIPRESNAIISYTIDVTAFRTGGASGSGASGDRAIFKLQGILRTNTATESVTTIVSAGVVTGWTVASSFSGSDWSIDVTGATGMNITWGAIANFYEMKL
tara:strand:+ start:25 stop:837 length:813 start_codon:yes stop_codon:yes gene_type:complete